MTTPGTSDLQRSDLYGIYNIVQNTLMSYPKELIISVLREEFAKDSYYHYVSDEFGYPKVVDLTDVPLNAGFQDDLTTRIYIGEVFHFNGIFYPSIFVKMTGARSVPVSFNRNKEVVQNEKILVIDGYGNEKEYYIPKYIDLAGAWEGTISIDISTRDIYTRDNLISILMMMFVDVRFETLRKAGVLIKSGQPVLSGVTETDDRQQDKLYKATITIDVRTEWRRLIPIGSIIERINFCIDFINPSTQLPSPNLQINSYTSILDQIENL
jgi:hypothetical protein